MLKVDVFGIELGEDINFGSIVLDNDNHLIPSDTNSKVLNSIIIRPIIGPNGLPIDPKDNPRSFIKFLYYQYKSYILRCTKARKI